MNIRGTIKACLLTRWLNQLHGTQRNQQQMSGSPCLISYLKSANLNQGRKMKSTRPRLNSRGIMAWIYDFPWSCRERSGMLDSCAVSIAVLISVMCM
ncbi:hypothetical protein BDW75DRAFT_224199 [Aspergillus navahoensis]